MNTTTLTIYEKNSLISDLVVWLSDCEKEDIIEYVKALSEDDKNLPDVLSDELIGAARKRITADLQIDLKSNAPTLLPENILLQFLTDLTQYSPRSVLKNYQKEYPDLRMIPNDTDISNWALSALILWNNIFYLLTAGEFLQYRLYLESVYKLNYSKEQYSDSYEVATKLVSKTADILLGNNFANTSIPTPLDAEISSFLKSFNIFPEEYIENLINYKTKDLYNLLQGLSFVLDLVAKLKRVLKPEDVIDISEILQNRLQFNKMSESIVARSQDLRTRNTPADLDKMIDSLDKTITFDKVIHDQTYQYISQYLNTLGPGQKEKFLSYFWAYAKNNLLFISAFEGIDLDSLEVQLKKNNYEPVHAQLINSIQQQVDPDIWLLVQKLLQILTLVS